MKPLNLIRAALLHLIIHHWDGESTDDLCDKVRLLFDYFGEESE